MLAHAGWPTRKFSSRLEVFLLWLGLRVWRDRATFGEVLNQDFEKMP